MLFLIRTLAITGGVFLLVVTGLEAIKDWRVNMLVINTLIMPTAIGIASITFGRLLPKKITVPTNGDLRNKSENNASRVSIGGMLNLLAAIAGIVGTAIALLQYFEI